VVSGSEARDPSIVGGTQPSILAAAMSEAVALEPDPVDASRRLLEMVVTSFADWGTLHLVDADGVLRRVAAHHVDPTMEPLARRLLDGPPVDPTKLPEIGESLHAGLTRAFAYPPDRLAEIDPSPGVVEAWRTMGAACGLTVPLRSGDRTVGVIALVSASPDRFPPDRVRTIEIVVREGALMADTARLARRSEAEAGARVRVRTVLDALLGDAPLAAVVVDRDLRVLHHNRALDGLVVGDHTALDAADTSLLPLAAVLPDLAGELTDLASRVLAEGEAVAPLDLPTGPATDRRHWQVNAFPIRRTRGELFGVGLIFVDVTVEKVALAHQQESRARLELSLEAGGMGSWEWDLGSERVEWSSGMEAITGLGSPGAGGAAGIARIAGEDHERLRARLVEAASTGEDLVDVSRVVRAGGEERWLETRARVIRSGEGVPVRMIGVSTDVTQRHVMEDIKLKLLEREHQARLTAEASRERLAILAEVSLVLASTLDPREVYETLARLLVPRFADWCSLDALSDEGEITEMAVVHIDPRLTDLVRRLRGHLDARSTDGLWSVRRAMRTARSERFEDITDDDYRAVADGPDELRLLQTLAPRSALVAPLIARGRVLGGITLVKSGSRTYDADDQALIENVAGRAATAVDTAMLFDSRTEVARALQQTLLPPALPDIPGLDVWADYRVAEAGIEIGGDFYDVFETEQGWYVVLGDVCGKGPAAAAVTGLFRHTLRAVAPGLPGVPGSTGPAALLRATSDAILDQIDDTRFATAVLVQLTPSRGGTRASVSCGGHPRPVLVRADGSVERVEASGTLLGVLPDPTLQEVTLELRPGDSLVLYTDGVTEARDGPEQFGEGRLMESLHRAAGLSSARGVSEHLIAAVDAFRDPQSAADDIAVIAIRVPGLHDAPPTAGA